MNKFQIPHWSQYLLFTYLGVTSQNICQFHNIKVPELLVPSANIKTAKVDTELKFQFKENKYSVD